MNEIWKDIPGYEGLYQVSNLGNVKSLSRIIKHAKGGNKTTKERMLKPGVNKSGYCRVVLFKDSLDKTFPVHQLVAMGFLGHIPCGHESVVDHINNNSKDNRVENLQVITHRENVSKDIKGCYSIYTGVSWHKNKNKWIAGIRINGKSKHLGYFENEYDAHLKYQETLKTFKL